MKKFLVVLTILVLVAGFAFADSKLTGTVTAEYAFDFNAKTLDYNVSGTNAKIEWTWDSQTVGPYEAAGKPYATVTVALSLTGNVGKDEAAKWSFANSYETGVSFGDFSGKLTLKEAKIVGEDWSVDLLKAAMYGEYAASAWEKTFKITSTGDVEDYKAFSFVNNLGGKVNGITVDYKEYSFGVGAAVDAAETFTLNVSSQSKVFTFEGGSAQAAAIVGIVKAKDQDAKFTFSVSAKADYTLDKLSAKAAFDGRYENEKFNEDVALTVAYKPVTFDFFYASLMNAPYGIYSAAEKKNIDYPANYEKYMSARVSVNVADIAENVPVTAYVGIKDALNKSTGRELVAGADYKTETITAEMSTAYDFTNKDFIIGGTAELTKLVAGFGVEGGADYMVFKSFGGTQKLAAAKVGLNYTDPEEKFVASLDVVLARWTGSKNIKAGFTTTVYSNKLVENAKLYATLTIDDNLAVTLYDFAEVIRGHEVDGRLPQPSYVSTKSLVVGCEIAF